MKTSSRLLILILSAITMTSFALAQEPDRKGWWKFDDPANLLKAETGYGTALELVGSHQATSGPTVENGAAKIGIGSYYKMSHGIAPNGGGTYVNEYTLQIDFKVKALGIWHSFFQTNLTNSNDGDCFINPEGNIGVAATGYSSYPVKTNEWYRLVISVKNNSFYRYYLDGQLLLNGTVQSRDGRFGLDKMLLVFADENGEDGEIDCAELAIWDKPLTPDEAMALGGYGHNVESKQLILVPFLQTPTPNSIYVCWHDTSAAFTRVEYGLTQTLGQATTGSSEIVGEPYRWHTVKLIELQPNTEYFYRVVSGSGSSAVYSFRTAPGRDFTGKIRFLLLSDTHSGDTTMVNKVIKAARTKIGQLYGPDLQNQINAVLHSGDIVLSGNSINQYTDEFFGPMAPLSPYIPFMITIGNHEGESAYYYKYVKYDDFPVVPPMNNLNEKMWSFTIANTMVIGLNTNIAGQYTSEKSMLDAKLQQVENDPTIDFIFIMFHHTPFTEIWGEALTLDSGPAFVTNQLFPVIKKYSKVVQVTYGHTHAFERGTIESDNENGDFRIVCAGGGGGETDRWGVYTNRDYPQIHIALDHHSFQIVEIDVAQKSVQTSMYSLGNSDRPLNTLRMDHWYRKLNQSGPAKPSTSSPHYVDGKVIFDSSPLSGVDSLMTVRMQVSDDSTFTNTQIDTLEHWKDIYGVDTDFIPIDRNAGLDLTRLAFNQSRFSTDQAYYYRVKYRDHNLKWSEWSNTTLFHVETGVEKQSPIPQNFGLEQNYPNPFNPTTIIHFQIPKSSHVLLQVFNSLGQEVATLVDGDKPAGIYMVEFNAEQLSAGVYYYRLRAEGFESVRNMVVAK
jgi:hypothetical protein